MPRSLKDPIKSPVIPWSDDQDAIIWLTSWLNNRRQQLFNNVIDYPYSTTKYYKPNNKKRGDIRDDGFDYGVISLNRNPLHWLKGNNPNRMITNKAFYTQIENAASAPQHIIYPNNKSSNFESRGMYVEPNYYDNTGHYIVYPGTPDNGTNIHERTHAMHADPQEYIINKYLDKNKYNHKYLDKKQEIYGRLMQYRYNNNLKPTDVIDKKYLKEHEKELEDLNLRRYDDDFLMFLFNDVAQNNKSKERRSLEDIYNT